jgi:glucose-1-phosphate thymidylyltransferase
MHNHWNTENILFNELTGIIPAGGKASRISPLPCSKELFPIGFRSVNQDESLRPKVVSHYLLENMRLADIKKAFIILREGKWDIPSYFSNGKMLDMNFAYLMVDLPFGVPYTLDQAYPFVKDSIVALGFPDIIFEPADAYRRLLFGLSETNADMVLGLFPTNNPHKTDMVELDDRGKVRGLHIKPEQTLLTYSWEIAVWKPAFTHYMHNYLSSRKENINDLIGQKELFVGDVIQAAIQDNVHIESVIFSEGRYFDIGTPEDLIKAVQIANRGNDISEIF